jgi:hypothetical protein
MPWRRVGAWTYSATTLDLGARWRWVVSLRARPLYPQYPLDRRLGGPQFRFGRCGEEKNLASVGIRTPAVQGVARLYTHWVIPARSIVTQEFYLEMNTGNLPGGKRPERNADNRTAICEPIV